MGYVQLRVCPDGRLGEAVVERDHVVGLPASERVRYQGAGRGHDTFVALPANESLGQGGYDAMLCRDDAQRGRGQLLGLSQVYALCEC